MKPLLHNEGEFERFVESIDATLRSDGVPFEARSLAALSVASRRLKTALPVWTADRLPRDGIYMGMDLTIRIVRWFQDRYGERAAWDPRPGRTVVILKGDAWEIILPRFFGSFLLFTSPTEPSESFDPVVKPGDPLPKYNMVEAVSQLAPGLKRALDTNDLGNISDAFRCALDCYHLMEGVRSLPLMKEAQGDVDVAVNEIMKGRARYGASKWASLQGAEKALKAFIASKGEKIGKHHDLHKLSKSAFELGLGMVPPDLLVRAQASASMRYREVDVDLAQAVDSHYASVDICAHVCSYLTEKAPEAFKHYPS